MTEPYKPRDQQVADAPNEPVEVEKIKITAVHFSNVYALGEVASSLTNVVATYPKVEPTEASVPGTDVWTLYGLPFKPEVSDLDIQRESDGFSYTGWTDFTITDGTDDDGYWVHMSVTWPAHPEGGRNEDVPLLDETIGLVYTFRGVIEGAILDEDKTSVVIPSEIHSLLGPQALYINYKTSTRPLIQKS